MKTFEECQLLKFEVTLTCWQCWHNFSFIRPFASPLPWVFTHSNSALCVEMLSSRISRHATCLKIICRGTSTTNDAKSMQTPNPRKVSSDMVGPPDPVSNLRKIIYKQPANESELEKRYRELRIEAQKWNHEFWTKHNSRFFQVNSHS